MVDEGRGGGRPAVEEVVCTAAGVADLLLTQAKKAVQGVSHLRRRSDLLELVQTGRDDLKARGELALHRYVTGPSPAHLEVLARRVKDAAGDDA
jgi:hypothetical protein